MKELLAEVKVPKKKKENEYSKEEFDSFIEKNLRLVEPEDDNSEGIILQILNYSLQAYLKGQDFKRQNKQFVDRKMKSPSTKDCNISFTYEKDRYSDWKGTFGGDSNFKIRLVCGDVDLGSIQIKRMVNCCGVAVITKVWSSYMTTIENLKIFLTLCAELIAYGSGYCSAISTYTNTNHSENLKNIDWNVQSSVRSVRTDHNICICTKVLTKESFAKNLKSFIYG